MIRFNVSLYTSGKGYESYAPGEFEEVTPEESKKLHEAMYSTDILKPFVLLEEGEVVARLERCGGKMKCNPCTNCEWGINRLVEVKK